MILALATQRILEVMSALDGNTVDPLELEERGVYYATKLRQHLINYGLELSGYADRGQVADYRAILRTNDTNQISTALAIIRPLSVSLELADIDAIVPSPVNRAALKSNWAVIAPELQKLNPADWLETFERIGTKLIFARQPEQEKTVEQAAIENIQFEEWCNSNGLRVPSSKTPRELHHEEEVRQRRAREDQRFANDRYHDSSWSVREFPTGD